MNRGDLIDSVAKGNGMTKAKAEKAVDGILKAIAGALAGGDKVTLVGFGTFAVSERAARQGRNPQTGKAIKIPARKVVKFKAGSKLSATVK